MPSAGQLEGDGKQTLLEGMSLAMTRRSPRTGGWASTLLQGREVRTKGHVLGAASPDLLGPQGSPGSLPLPLTSAPWRLKHTRVPPSGVQC